MSFTNPFEIPKSSFFEQIGFNYLTKFLYKASKSNTNFSQTDLPTLKPEFEPSALYKNFSKIYSPNKSLLWCLLKSIGAPLYCVIIASLLLLIICAAEPIYIRQLLASIENTDKTLSEGLKLCMIIIGLTLMRNLIYNFMYMLEYISAAKTSIELLACIFEKSLKLVASEYDRQGPGKILYLLSKAKRVSRFIPFLKSMLVDPMKLVITTCLFANEVGYGFILVIIAGSISFIINVYISRRLQKMNEKRDSYGKQGMKYTGECIRGIKTIKLNTWEEFAKNKIGDSYQNVKNCDISIGLLTQLNECQKELFSQTIIISAIFISFWLEGGLSAPKAYMLLVLYQQIRYPLFSLASLFSRYAEVKQGLKMIEEFLLLEEKNTILEIENSQKHGELLIKNITASCYEINENKQNDKNNEKPRIVLSELNFKINQGELVGIVGPVGSGKSLLFRCILQELKIDNGNILYNGKIVYLPQEPWIFSDTLKANILMNSEFDAIKYEKIIDSCDLKNDIELLPNKDLTIIGGRGVNLSGGQRQRVALARALYNNGDIYIFDDSLSQLDSQAATKVFKSVIFDYLKSKTRLFITGNAKKLIDFTRILLMQNGKICAEGSYSELVGLPSFSSILVKDQASPKKHSEENNFPNKPIIHQNPSSSIKTNLSTNLSNPTNIQKSVEPQKLSIFSWKNIKPFIYENHNMPYVICFAIFILMIVTGEGFRDRWLFIWSCNCYSWDFYTYLSIYVFIIIANLCSGLLKQYTQKIYEKRFMRQTNQNVMNKTLLAPLGWHDITPSGKIIRCVTNIFDEVFAVFTQGGNIMQNLGVFLIGSYQILVEVPEFSIIIIALIIWIIFLRKTSSTLIMCSMKFEENNEESLNTAIQEILDGLYIIRANNGEYIPWAREKVYKIMNNLEKARLVRNFATLWMDLRWKIITCFIFGVVIITCFTRKGILVTSAIGFILQCVVKMCWILELMCMNYEELEAYMISYARLLNFIENIPQENTENPLDLNQLLDWPKSGNICANNLCVKYQENLPYIIKNANFNINPGDKITIMGRSGTGKSTLLLSLVRIIEPLNDDAIIIDNTKISQIPLSILRSKITMLPQESWLFSGTIHDNIDPLRKYSETDILQAFDKLNLLPLLQKKQTDQNLKSKSILDIEISENGSNLSQGEKQLICIARAFLRNSKILLLDEATANLDEIAESRVMHYIETNFNNSSVLMISHRENILEISNRILKVKDKIIEEVQNITSP